MRRATGNRPRIEIFRYSAQWAIDEVKEGGSVHVLVKGHAEVWNSESEAVGYLTKSSLALYRKLGGEVA
jgi:hypothetical protein